jgi:RNA polymerase-binding transcription factor DksA
MLDLKDVHTSLVAKLAIITNELKAIAVYDAPTDNWEAVPDTSELQEADSNSEADVIEAWNERRATVAALETEYRDIKRAIQKIDDGTYGVCEISGEPIEENRLQAYPTARTCTKHFDQEFELSL